MWGAGLWFWFVFLWWLATSSIFSFAYCHLHIFFGKCLLRSSAHFLIRLFFLVCFFFGFFLILNCMSCLCILDVSLLLFILFATIFSQKLSFHFVNGLFCSAKTLNLITSNFLIFASVSFALGDRSEKHHCYNLCQRVFCFLLGVLWFGVVHWDL